MDSHFALSALQYDRRVFIGTVLVLTFLITYLMTSLKSGIAIRRKKRGAKPPIMPYWIPFLGNMVPLLWDPSEYCSKIA